MAAEVPGLARLDLDLSPLRDQLAASTVARRLLREAPPHDVVHCYTQQIGLLATQYLRDRPAIIGTDATSTQSARLLPYRSPTATTPYALAPTRRLERRVYDAATLVVAQSDWAQRSMVDDYGIDPGRIRVIRYGITVDDVPDVEPDDPPTICWIGRSMARKGGRWLLDVWRQRSSATTPGSCW